MSLELLVSLIYQFASVAGVRCARTTSDGRFPLGYRGFRGLREPKRSVHSFGGTFIMKFSSIVARQRVAGISAGCLLGGIAMGIVGAPSAAAAPDCSPEGVNATVSSVTGAAQQYLAAHPGANQVVSSSYGQ